RKFLKYCTGTHYPAKDQQITIVVDPDQSDLEAVIAHNRKNQNIRAAHLLPLKTKSKWKFGFEGAQKCGQPIGKHQGPATGQS
uniref:Uncharacterized protein n=1 Tax=Romanomermis culicivorax TaxID=13658 RepID=A0A915IN60_ROMCU